jgi:hypothetical protein
MWLASGEALLLAAKAPDMAVMTETDAVKLLGELRAPDEPRQRNTRQQRRGRRDPVTEAIKQQPLGILERAMGGMLGD